MAELKLTPQQQAVVHDRGGTLLVSAAAGSGKTKVLVDRVLDRIISEGKNIHEFLIITFKNAAAAELRAKISEAISRELSVHPENRHLSRQLNLLQMSHISTVHAFCGTVIREYGYLLDIPSDFRVLDDGERQELLQKQLDLLLDDAYEKQDPVNRHPGSREKRQCAVHPRDRIIRKGPQPAGSGKMAEGPTI